MFRSKKEANPQAYIVIEKPMFNYSSQKLNTANAAVLDFRNAIRNVRNKFFYLNKSYLNLNFLGKFKIIIYLQSGISSFYDFFSSRY